MLVHVSLYIILWNVSSIGLYDVVSLLCQHHLIASTHFSFNILCIHVLHWPALSRPSGGFLAIGLRPVFVVVVVLVVFVVIVLVPVLVLVLVLVRVLVLVLILVFVLVPVPVQFLVLVLVVVVVVVEV